MPENIINFMQSQIGTLAETFGPFFIFIKFIFFAVSIFLFLHIIYLIYKLDTAKDRWQYYSEVLTRKALPIHKNDFIEKWGKIKLRLDTKIEADWKLAIIEADKLFDELLKRMGYEGKDMGERLEQITPAQLPNLSAVWDSHKARNYLSHDIDYNISFSQAEKMIQNYENAFKKLEIFD